MSDNITWGDPIEVNGKRPAWLTDDKQTIRWIKPDGVKPREGGPCEAGVHNWGRYRYSPDRPTETSHIRLPANHFVYTVLRWNAEHPDKQPFEPWGGGDAAPPDWDGGTTLRIDHTASQMEPFVSNTTRDTAWDHTQRATCIVIGYRRKRDSAQPVFDPAPHLATYDPATHVAVPLMTEEAAKAWAEKEWRQWTGHEPAMLAALRLLGIIRPDPTPLDRFKAAHPDWALRDREDLIADVIAWREGT